MDPSRGAKSASDWPKGKQAPACQTAASPSLSLKTALIVPTPAFDHSSVAPSRGNTPLSSMPTMQAPTCNAHSTKVPMSSFVVRLCFAAICLCGWTLGRASALPPPPVVLEAETASFEIQDDIQSWLESSAGATVEQVSANTDVFQTQPAMQRHALDKTTTLWLRLRFVRRANAPTQWTLNIPLAFVDEVQMFQRTTDGQWQRQQAGDTLPQSDWSLRGPYPDFSLYLPDTQEHEVFLRVRNFKHLSVPIRVATVGERSLQRLQELVALGLLLGVLLLLVVVSVLHYAEHRNRLDIGAIAFSTLVLLATAQINGVLNMLVWPQWPVLADYAFSILPVLAVGSSLLFVRMLYAISTHYSRYDRFLRGIGILALVSSLTHLIDRSMADKIGVVVVMLATTTGLVATFLSWRGNSRIWPWLIAAYLPQYLSLLRMMCEAIGWFPIWWEMRYIMSLSLAFSVPMLVYALHRVTRERKELQSRAQLLPTQDALTGLLTREVFLQELETAHTRVIEQREPIALVVVRVVNYELIRHKLGDQMAENSLLRAVVKLHRVLRDVDPAGRVGSGEFGLILDGVRSRHILTERMVQLIGSGLIPLPGLHPPITLQFHAACVLLHEYPINPQEALPALQTLLNSMSLHTRRPIRFLEAPKTMPVPLSGSSFLP